MFEELKKFNFSPVQVHPGEYSINTLLSPFIGRSTLLRIFFIFYDHHTGFFLRCCGASHLLIRGFLHLALENLPEKVQVNLTKFFSAQLFRLVIG